MTTNTYQALCDDVEAYEDTTKPKAFCQKTCKWGNKYKLGAGLGCGGCLDKEFGDVTKRIYPPQSAEQRERLEELILNLGRLSYHKSDIYYICILSRVNNANNGMAGTRHEALYALTHKLVQEGVLSKEEVKEALNGK